jgi:hypothetical protein
MPKPEGYVEVNVRIQKFYEKYPAGSLQSACSPFVVEAAGKWFVVYGCAAYRSPDDPKPGMGWAWEPVPGPTNFTKDSELMNAETSAWGRAIAALGFEVKEGIASANEVRSRQVAPRSTEQGTPSATTAGAAGTAPAHFQSPAALRKAATKDQLDTIRKLVPLASAATGESEAKVRSWIKQKAGVQKLEDLTEVVATDLIPSIERWIENSAKQDKIA